MDLSQLRQQIDTIDRQIVDLYEKRMDVSRQVAEYKIETGKKVFDKQREQEKIAGVKALTHNDFNSHGVEELFEQIMSMSRKLQYQLLAAHGSEGRLPFKYLKPGDKPEADFHLVEHGTVYAYCNLHGLWKTEF